MDIDTINRFELDPSNPPLDIKRIVKILHEIKGLKNEFPQVSILARSNYDEILVTNVEKDSKHSIQLKFDKSGWKIVDHQLPIEINASNTTNLISCVRTYLVTLENLQPFYTALQELDCLCIKGEPDVVTPRTSWRLVKYNSKVFIRIEFKNPLCTDEISVTFHGCTNSVREMEEIFHSRLSQFEDENNTIYQKLLQIFDTPYFPATIEEKVGCSICLSYRCDETGGIPIIYCENSKCSSSFHTSCLEKYLKERKHVTVLSICIGECPYCKNPLSNSYATLLQNLNSEKQNEEI